jgi:putative flavoprotein involved in K+ transport
LRLVGWFERLSADLPRGAHAGTPNPQLTGAAGGHDINPHTLARDGVTLLGRLSGISDGIAHVLADLPANVAWGDEQALAFLRSIDHIVDAQQLATPEADVPDELNMTATERRRTAEDRFGSAPTEFNLVASGVSTIVWATGYRPDFGWVQLPFLDADGYPIQRRGITPVAGLYVLGLDWLHTAKSGLFAGIGDDAGYLASVISAGR